MGSEESCNSLASRSDGIRGLRASTASSQSAGASRATAWPKLKPSLCAACTASGSATATGCGTYGAATPASDWAGAAGSCLARWSAEPLDARPGMSAG